MRGELADIVGVADLTRTGEVLGYSGSDVKVSEKSLAKAL